MAININWENSENLILLNPRLPEEQSKTLNQLAKYLTENWKLDSHVLIASSGSNSGGNRIVALSKNAILHSARAVNQHLKVASQDIWAQVLPIFHVGGLGIEARAYLSGSKIVDALDAEKKWNTQHFYQVLNESKITLCSLVPTQVYDLVQVELRSPKTLRAIVVGGAQLTQELYLQARDLGWPLLPSYGMTETCSQVATASLESLKEKKYPKLQLLPNVLARTNSDNFLEFHTQSLLTCYAAMTQDQQVRVWDPKILDGWLTTEDKGEVVAGTLNVFGRGSDFIKIGGELVNLVQLRDTLQKVVIKNKLLETQFVLIEKKDDRLGSEIHLVTECRVAQYIEDVCAGYNKQVLPIAKIRGVHTFEQIPRSELGKPLMAEIRKAMK